MQLGAEEEEEEGSPPANELLYVGVNQDQGCFACGTTSGFRIYNCAPFKLTFERGAFLVSLGRVSLGRIPPCRLLTMRLRGP